MYEAFLKDAHCCAFHFQLLEVQMPVLSVHDGAQQTHSVRCKQVLFTAFQVAVTLAEKVLTPPKQDVKVLDVNQASHTLLSWLTTADAHGQVRV